MNSNGRPSTPSTADSEKSVKGIARLRLSQLDEQAAEAAVLASMILDPTVIPDVQQVIPNPTLFADSRNRRLWLSILKLYESNNRQGIDGVVLRGELAMMPEFGAGQGVTYLEEILNTVPSAANAVYYARIVRDRAVRRNLIDAGQQVINIASEEGDITEVSDRAQMTVSRACEAIAYQEGTTDCMAALQAAYDDLERKTQPKIPVTYCDLAMYVPGFKAGQMVVIAGRPGQGKTALAISLLVRLFLHPGGEQKRVLFISFEMLAQELMQRVLSAVSGVPFQAMASQTIDAEQWKHLNESLPVIQPWDLAFADRLTPTPGTVRNLARRLHNQQPLDAIVVDYIQRMHCPDKHATRDWEMTVISNGLKNLALELQVPVIVLSQLNRECDRREDHRPRLADLRDSGTLEQDADIVLMVYRADCYEHNPEKHTHEAEIVIAKQRNGQTGIATLVFREAFMSFENRAPGGWLNE